jgi:conjugal transfer pilus assembly protein TraV
MKTTRISLLTCAVLALTGCAGMKDDFDCKAVASDSCITMRQADEKARAQDQSGQRNYQPAGSRSGPAIQGRGRLPSLIDMSRSLAPVRLSEQPSPLIPTPSRVLSAPAVVSTPPVATSYPASDTGRLEFTRKSSSGLSDAPDALGAVPSTTPADSMTHRATTCTPTHCPNTMAAPQRQMESVVRLWVAPYVDSVDAVHAPSEVFFVRSPADWRDRYEP